MITNVLDYLEKSALKLPNKVLFKDVSSSVSYCDVVNGAKQIGSLIADTLPGMKNQPIGVFIDRDVQSLIMFFGICYSGNFYVPLDMNLPVHQLRLIIDTLDLKIILGEKDGIVIVEKLDFEGKFIPYEDIETHPSIKRN